MLPRHCCCFALLALATAPVAAQSVSLRANDGAHLAALIADAERRGEEYSRFDPAAQAIEGAPVLRIKDQPVVSRSCVRATGLGPVRSGEFEIGGELSSIWRAGGPKIWWSPVFHGPEMPLMEIKATDTADPQRGFDFRASHVVYGMSRPSERPDEERRNYFFATGIGFPGPGQWLLVATSGPNWGCFVITVDGGTPPFPFN